MRFFNIRRWALFMTIALCSYSAMAQDTTRYSWWDPSKNSFPVIGGQAWPSGMAASYSRLPARAEKDVRPEVWKLAGQSAGLSVRFRTTASEIVVRYTVAGKLEMPHMPATGVSGVDLYALDENGGWRWAAGKYKFADTITWHFSNIGNSAREYRLYLPLYNQVKWLEIGVPGTAAIQPLPVRQEKPIVVYGTSIAQGGCTSRPGLAWTTQVDRQLDRQVINLGFSGNGRLEPPIIELISEIDAKVYVLDCLPNISGMPPAEIQQRIIDAVKLLRRKRPNTPILLTGHPTASIQMVNTLGGGNYSTANTALADACQQLQQAGIRQLYLLPASDIHFDLSATVDGVHPGDAGMQAYADAYVKTLRHILQEPEGTINTTIACRQYRELMRYDWDARHNEILSMNKAHAPKVAILGNSIIHFWGGLPQGPYARGADSWKAVMDAAGTRNMGFGWDRVENVLWRVYHEELDGYDAKKVIVMIGTNNLQMNTNAEIIAGLQQLIAAIRQRQPKADILLAGILPRREMEERVVNINNGIMQLAGTAQVQFINPGQVLLLPDRHIDEKLFTDGLHPNAEGYNRLASFLQPYLK
ncbi:SGNH/GDSL hydrolase family protein [Chitinophaga tropicalis]|uniref:Acetylhydrolase n=1 Tax=Chitinophaga tropicalis TaxID=2683588 RepID=A0A7K1U8M5_9BACT|nr:SGNH/GDSL hydrolase family protein [Chitinophaga tropicalis]MVT10719.1 acetylhydrolase [Chitinophaga tropicalis]